MQEKDLNRILFSSFRRLGGWGFKIPDTPRELIMRGDAPKPFDGVGVYNNKSYYIESKFSNGLKSFNFNQVKDHQIYHLTEIRKASKDSISFVLLGVWESRKYFDVFCFDIDLINKLKTDLKKSILKKELLKLYDENLFSSIKSEKAINGKSRVQTLYIDNLKIIGTTEWNNVMHV